MTLSMPPALIQHPSKSTTLMTLTLRTAFSSPTTSCLMETVATPRWDLFVKLKMTILTGSKKLGVKAKENDVGQRRIGWSIMTIKGNEKKYVLLVSVQNS